MSSDLIFDSSLIHRPEFYIVTLDRNEKVLSIEPMTGSAPSAEDIEFEVTEDGRKFYPLKRFDPGDVADIKYRGETQRVYIEDFLDGVVNKFQAKVCLVSGDGTLSDPVTLPVNGTMAALVKEEVTLKKQPDTSRRIYCEDQYELLPI